MYSYMFFYCPGIAIFYVTAIFSFLLYDFTTLYPVIAICCVIAIYSVKLTIYTTVD